MLGIKLVAMNGNEGVFEANSVDLAPSPDAQTSDEKVLFIHRPDGIVIVDTGDVYVMNGNGRTIADYHFFHGYNKENGTIISEGNK